MASVQKVGGGLVEISAVTTIIGAPIAEALIHGLKGACAVPWAPVSCFGIVHVAKACLAAAVPDWLREAMGLRNGFVDSAVGIVLPINQFKQARHRNDIGDPLAIQFNHPREKNLLEEPIKPLKRKLTDIERESKALRLKKQKQLLRAKRGQCLYTLDRNSQFVLGSVPAAEKGEEIKIHHFRPDIDGMVPAWKDWLVLLSSAVKFAEAAVMHRLGSRRLWIWTLVGWGYAFIAASIIQLAGLGRDSPLRASRDIAAGVLPSHLQLGDHGKIILNAPANVRRRPLWRFLLGLGTLFNVAEVLGTFIYLELEPMVVVYTWVAFQLLWLVCRTVVFYFVEGASAARQGLITSQSWGSCENSDRRRVLNLLEELSKHQISTHARGFQAYAQDIVSLAEVAVLLEGTDWRLTMQLPVPDPEKSSWNLEVAATTGDPAIRSAMWFLGTDLENMEIYDACIIFVPNGPASHIAVPVVRVYCCDCARAGGPRDRGNAHPPCGRLEWVHFVPATIQGNLRWVVAHSPKGVGVLATDILTTEELDMRLSIGKWNISLKSVNMVLVALDTSRRAAAAVLSMLKDGSNPPP